MKCEHEFENSKAFTNLATNGRSFNPTDWEKGEGIYQSRTAMVVPVLKCKHCGKSIANRDMHGFVTQD